MLMKGNALYCEEIQIQGHDKRYKYEGNLVLEYVGEVYHLFSKYLQDSRCYFYVDKVVLGYIPGKLHQFVIPDVVNR